MRKMTFRVVLPECSDDSVSRGLRFLTEAIFKKLKEADGGFLGLGGRYGYGASWGDDIFMMHPYCWCERDDCPWCTGGCNCPEESFHYFIDGEEVEGGRYLGFYSENVPDASNPQWKKISNQINKRRGLIHEEDCDYCNSEGVFKEHGRESPNFWHKPTNFKVWWYKYIGRSMEIENPNKTRWCDILKDCLGDVTKEAPGPLEN